MIKTELHIHTRFSHDSLLPLWLLNIMCRIHRIECIAITDHNEIEGAILFKKSYPKIFVIIGEEIFSEEGEIIGLFLNERISPGLSAYETIKQIRSQNGIVYIPHPSDVKRQKSVLSMEAISKNQDQIQCIEIFNGRTLNIQDLEMQQTFSKHFNLPGLVGSDAHTFFEIGRNYMILPDFMENPNDFINAITKAEIHTAHCLHLSHLTTKFERGIKFIFTGQFQKNI